ncbi:MAG: hypothetical protein ABF991_10590 [Liquorilactobacillus hordei]|uniref:PTS sugar transporter subunit IIA n=1 Tax=Liquorilactobacillus TaxID=2767888 RepID=UPI0039E777C2
MNQFIIATHGELADGFNKTIHFFNNSLTNVHFINAYIDDESFEDSFVSLVEDLLPSDLFVFTDLPGGSVNRTVCQYIDKYKLKVLSGVNLSLLLELVMKEEKFSEEDLRNSISDAREQLVFMNDLFSSVEEEEEID